VLRKKKKKIKSTVAESGYPKLIDIFDLNLSSQTSLIMAISSAQALVLEMLMFF